MPKKAPAYTPQPVKPSLFGNFNDVGFITTDADKGRTDPYIKAEVIPSRYTGQNFKVGRPKKGHGRDAYFGGKILTFAANDQNAGGKCDDYLDSGVRERREAKAKKAKNIDSKDFKYVSYPKKSTGPGSYFGCLDTKPIPHQQEYNVVKRDAITAKVETKRPKNIITNPGKKGTFGYVGTTFSKVEAPTKNDDYDAQRKLEQEQWKKSKEKMITNVTFRTTIRGVQTFDQKTGTGVSAVYDTYTAPEGKEKKSRKPKKEVEKKPDDRPPFKYSSGTKRGDAGNLNSFPNKRGDKPDPYDDIEARQKAEKNKKAAIGGTWKPVSGAKSSVVRSLLKTYY